MRNPSLTNQKKNLSTIEKKTNTKNLSADYFLCCSEASSLLVSGLHLCCSLSIAPLLVSLFFCVCVVSFLFPILFFKLLFGFNQYFQYHKKMNEISHNSPVSQSSSSTALDFISTERLFSLQKCFPQDIASQS